MVWKTPNEQMYKVWDVLDLFIRAKAGLGYSLSVLISGGWFLHARFQRKNAERENRRLSKSRTKEQQQFFKSPLESSDALTSSEE